MAMKHGGRGPGHLSRWTAATSPIPYLFASGSQGAWFDLTDTSTWYQDAARTTPAATLGDVVGGIADKSGRGNHASQATTAQKPLRARIPLGGRRNMLTYTEEFDNAVWLLDNSGATNPVVTANYTTGPDGSATADRVQLNKTGGAFSRVQQTANISVLPSAVYIFSVYMKNNAGGTANVGLRISSTGVNCAVTTAWQRFSVALPSAGTSATSQIMLFDSIAGNDETADISVWGAQVERASVASAYQKVVADWDVTESGVTSIPALYFDGSDDSLATAAIDFATCTSDGAARRNLLLYPTDYGNAVYTITSGTTVVGDTATFTTTAYRYQSASIGSSVLGRTFTSSVTLSSPSKANIALRLNGNVTGADAAVSLITLTPTPTRYSVTRTFTSTDTNIDTGLDNRAAFGAGIAGDVVVTDWQLEESATATAFQDIGTDKMTVFAGVEKLSDVAQGCVLEFGNAAPVGSFSIWAPPFVGAYYAFWSKGTALASGAYAGGYPAPNTSILTGIGNISADQSILRANGAQVASDATDQGTGNYSNSVLYIGRRAGTTYPFKGYMIGHMVIVGELANASEIAAVEALERAATGAY